jgi:SpoVK/Ycf46/Vps4 family AAA+-type ATPase
MTEGGGHGMCRSATSAEARVLSTFLNEMDGVDASQEDGVLVLGATNRPSTLDAALLRPGRFDSIIYVPPPDEEGRKAMLEMQCHRWKCQTLQRDKSESFVDVNLLASDAMTGSMTGAEILGACREAAMRALRETLETDSQDIPRMKQVYLEESLRNV